jgi:hypothetical protein
MVKYRTPKPRKNDIVEKVDLSRMFGMVKKIVKPNFIFVEWNDGVSPKITKEKIKDLALVAR